MAHPKLWGTTDTRNGLPTTTKESPDFSHGECQTTNKLPHQELVKALIRVIGFTGEGDCASENFVILSSYYAKPKIFLTERGLQKLKNWFEKNRDSMFYIEKSTRRYSKRNPAGIKRIGYQVGKKVFEISPDSEC